MPNLERPGEILELQDISVPENSEDVLMEEQKDDESCRRTDLRLA